MATAGSGDVLSGIIAGVAAGFARMNAWQDQDVDRAVAAAISGVYAHGLAGDIACAQLGERSMLSGDIVDALPQAFSSLDRQLFR
jgi:NAD(P)H-hydrate epimerase